MRREPQVLFIFLFYFFVFLVDQGSFAQHNTAPEISGAVFLGESRLYATKCCGEDEIRTRELLLASLIDFFKDNPAWE